MPEAADRIFLRAWQDLPYNFDQVIGGYRLDNPPGGPRALALISLGAIAFRRKSQDWDEFEPRHGAYSRDEFDTADDRHINVGDDEIGLDSRIQFVECRLSVCGRLNFKSIHGESGLEAHHHRDGIVYDENLHCHFDPLAVWFAPDSCADYATRPAPIA